VWWWWSFGFASDEVMAVLAEGIGRQVVAFQVMRMDMGADWYRRSGRADDGAVAHYLITGLELAARKLVTEMDVFRKRDRLAVDRYRAAGWPPALE
jgi:hypothetical protein